MLLTLLDVALGWFMAGLDVPVAPHCFREGFFPKDLEEDWLVCKDLEELDLVEVLVELQVLVDLEAEWEVLVEFSNPEPQRMTYWQPDP